MAVYTRLLANQSETLHLQAWFNNISVLFFSLKGLVLLISITKKNVYIAQSQTLFANINPYVLKMTVPILYAKQLPQTKTFFFRSMLR